MASNERRSSGFADALGDLGGDAWASEPRPEKPRPDPASLRETAALVGFKSREGGKPAPSAPVVEPRRRRNYSGRSEQVNIKATPEFKARFQALAKSKNWTDAVTFEKAIELMEKNS